MRRFLLELLLFSAVLLVLDKGLILVRTYSPAPDMEVDRRLEWVLTNQLQADMLVFGSSRGARSVIAHMLSDSLGVRAYNLSYPGSDITFHTFLLDQAVAHLQPRPHTVLLVVDEPTELLRDDYINFRSDRLYPLIKYAPVRDALVKQGEKNGLLNVLLVSSQLTRSYLFPRQVAFNTMDTILPCGSMPVSFQDTGWNRQYDYYVHPYRVDDEIPEKRDHFQRFIHTCQANGLDLVLVFPPNFKVLSDGFEPRIRAFAGAEVDCMHYDTTLAAYHDPDNFHDVGHVNTAGARVFTQELIQYLKKRGK